MYAIRSYYGALQRGEALRERKLARAGLVRRVEKLDAHRCLLSDLAIDASADRQRDRSALVAVPGRDHRAEAARRAAGGDHQHVVRAGERSILAVV